MRVSDRRDPGVADKLSGADTQDRFQLPIHDPGRNRNAVHDGGRCCCDRGSRCDQRRRQHPLRLGRRHDRQSIHVREHRHDGVSGDPSSERVPVDSRSLGLAGSHEAQLDGGDFSKGSVDDEGGLMVRHERNSAEHRVTTQGLVRSLFRTALHASGCDQTRVRASLHPVVVL